MHTEYTFLMSLALDGEASVTEMAQLHGHLRNCATCADIWARWQAVDRRLAAASPALPTVDLAAQVTARVEAYELRRRRSRWLGSGFLLSWIGVVLGCAAIIAVGIGWAQTHPDLPAAVFSALKQLIGVVGWFLGGLEAFARSLGAPTLALGFGLLASVTCLLGMAWLWLMGRSPGWAPARAAA